MTTVAARPPRPIPTVQASPALLREGDMIYPDLEEIPDDADPFRVAHPVQRDDLGWLIFLDGGYLLYLPFGTKVRTQRRPNPGPPTPDEVWDEAETSNPEARYG